MEKKMENEMETGGIEGFRIKGFPSCVRLRLLVLGIYCIRRRRAKQVIGPLFLES